MKPAILLLLLLAGTLGCARAWAGTAVLECWFVQDAGGGRLDKLPAALLLRPGSGPAPPRPDLDPRFYLQVHDPSGALQAAFQRFPRDGPAPRCEISNYVLLPASAHWAAGLTREPSCPRSLDGAWYLASVTSPLLSLACLLRPQLQPSGDSGITPATAVLTVFSYTPVPQIRLGQDAVLDLSFAYAPPPTIGAAPVPGPPPFGLEWRRQHLGKGHLLLAATPGLQGLLPKAQEGAVAFAAWDDKDDPRGPWTGNGTLVLPAVRPAQEGTYLATVHLPYLQGQITVELGVQKPPKVSLMPAPVVWAAPGEAPPELVCHVSRFYPPEGLEVVWEVRNGSGGTSQKVKESQWLSALRHHSDGSVSVSGHLQLPPVTSGQHGARYFCRVRHPTLPTSVRTAEVTLEVAGLSGPSLEDGVGLFLSAFFLLGLFKVLGWVAAYLTVPKEDLKKKMEKAE